jgi:hypothetical protein
MLRQIAPANPVYSKTQPIARLFTKTYPKKADDRLETVAELTTHPPCGSGAAGPEGRHLSHRVALEPQNQAAIAAPSFNTGQMVPRDAMKSLGTPRDAIRPNGFFVEAIVNSATGS